MEIMETERSAAHGHQDPQLYIPAENEPEYL